jgi:hypothetical protein
MGSRTTASTAKGNYGEVLDIHDEIWSGAYTCKVKVKLSRYRPGGALGVLVG